MLDSPPSVKMFDMVLCFSRALDLLHPSICDHHLLVANVAAQLAEAAGLPAEAQRDVLIAGALHDVGAVSTAARLALSDFSLATYHDKSGRAPGSIHRHGYEGWRLLRDFAPFARAAEIIRYHHVDWQHGAGQWFGAEPVPRASHVLHLADRIAVLPRAGENILEQRERIRARIAAASGTAFDPELVGAFDALAERDSFWFDLVYPHRHTLVGGRAREQEIVLGIDALQGLAEVFGRIIDFRSPFTATHSAGVAGTATALAGVLGMDENEQKLIRVAGHLHDVGKLAVAPDILDKPGALSPGELSVMRSHTYHTYRILEPVASLETVNLWASFHHERMDGCGYPFRPGELPLGSRIVAVADVFTALSENRPYRPGMSRGEVRAVLRRTVADGALDGDIVATLLDRFDDFDGVRRRAQRLDPAGGEAVAA